MRTQPRRERVRTYPYEITCTACGARLVAVDEAWVVFVGPRPIEVVGGLDGDTHIACHQCGELVTIDGDLLLLH